MDSIWGFGIISITAIVMGCLESDIQVVLLNAFS